MYKSHRLLLVFGLLLCSIVAVFIVQQFLSPPGAVGTTVYAWLTTSDGSNRLTPQGNLNFASDTQVADSSTINVNENQQFQQMYSFSTAAPHPSSHLIHTYI